jgi:integrase
MTLGEVLERWVKDNLSLKVTPATKASYSSVIEHHIKPALGRKRLTKLQPDDVQALISSKLDAGLSPRTVRLIRGILVQVLNHAVRQGRVARNVAALTDGPRMEQRREGRSLTIGQAKKLLAAIVGERLEALYLVMITTGIRTGEALGLPWKHVDLEKGLITIRQCLSRQPGGTIIRDGKTGRKGWRTIELAPPVVTTLLDHRDRQTKERREAGRAWDDHGLVFCTVIGTPLDPDNHRKTFSVITKRAGIGTWRPHELRHSATSIMLAQRVPIEVVSKILGHTSIRITADVYGHLLDHQQSAAAKAMAEAFWD